MEYERLLNAVIKDLEKEKDDISKGRSTFGRGCKEYNENCKQSLIDYAENGSECLNKCEYCQKFKWVIDRAKHY